MPKFESNVAVFKHEQNNDSFLADSWNNPPGNTACDGRRGARDAAMRATLAVNSAQFRPPQDRVVNDSATNKQQERKKKVCRLGLS